MGLRLGVAGTLPVKPDSPVVERIAAGMPIAATTLASVGFEQGKIRVAIPLPFKLSNETPNGGYTPAPLRTAAPIIPRRKPTPVPTPTAEASLSPVPAPTASPDSAPSGAPHAATPPAPLPTPT